MAILQDIIQAAAEHRTRLREAIGCVDAGLSRDVEGVPDALAGLYRIAAGTPRAIKDQTLMDIVPGYRLIHQSELADEITAFRTAYPKLVTHYPFLADYSSRYFTVDSNDGVVYTVDLQYGAAPISRNLDRFLETIRAFYLEGVYCLAPDGYLDYDVDREGQIGATLNPEYPYWIEG